MRVKVGHSGLTPQVLEEIGTRLREHELVRVSGGSPTYSIRAN
jgi:RNA-binding protein YhbY